jgi:hypothetical protein
MDSRPTTRSTPRFAEVTRLVSRAARQGAALFAFAGLMLGTAALPARAEGAAELFLAEPASSGAKPAAVVPPGLHRARAAKINAPLLHDPASPLHHPSPAALKNPSSRLALSLYGDRQVTAVIENTEYKPGGRFIAHGVVEGVPGSRVAFSVDGDVVAGTVFVPGQDATQISYLGDGVHQIADLDQELGTACGAVLAPDQSGDATAIVHAPITAGTAPTVVDVAVLYTTAAMNGAGGLSGIQSQIDLAVDEANTCFSNSGINVTLNLVYRGEVTYSETSNPNTDLGRLQNPTDGQLDTAQSIRTQYGADLVCLVVEGMNTYAGLGYVMSPVASSFASYGYSVVKRQYLTGVYTFPHELGHNFGCNHDRQNASGSGAFSYSYGYRFDAAGTTYRTVMAYAPGTRIPYFSNPNVSYLGVATGVAHGQATEADNVGTINASADTVAAFSGPSTIIDFSTNAVTVAENVGSITLSLDRTGVVTNTSTVKVTTVAGTAKAGTDYTAVTQTVTFASGETNKTVSVSIVNDTAVEGTETFTVSLSAATGAVVGLNTPYTVTITDDDTTVALAAATASVLESATNAVLTVVRTGVTNTVATVNYATANGTALAGSDYTNTTGTVTFNAGETNKTISVPLVADSAIEGKETFTLTLSSPTNALLGSVTSSVVTIQDANVEFDFATASLTSSVLETAGKATLTVWRLGGTTLTNTVNFAVTTNGTAVAGTNVTSTNGTLTFLPGVTNLTVTLPVLHDGAVAGNKTAEVALTNPGGTATVGTNDTATVTIQDVDSIFNFTVVTNNVAENAGTVVLNVRRTGGLAAAAGVAYKSSTNGTATSGVDFTAATGTLSFAAGDTNKTITVKITNDSLLESDETFTVALSAPTGNATLGTNSTAVVNILEDDLNSFAFSSSTASVAENGTNMVLTVARTGSTNATSVKYTATAGTAKAGVDFTATTGTLSFANGDTSKTITVPILDNQKVDGDRLFTMVLSAPATNSVIGTNGIATVTITDDDTAVNFTAATATVAESATNAVLTLVRTGVTNTVVSVNYATTNGTALAGSDYTNTTGTVTFNAGETNKTISIPVVADSLIEGKETFSVRLLSPTNTLLGTVTNVVVTILDANVEFDFATASLTSSVLETAGKATLTVWRLGGTAATNTVNFALGTNGTAVAGTNYTSTNGTLTFLPGVTNLTVTLPVLHDGVVAGDKTAVLKLSSPGGTATVGTNDTATVTIQDVDSTFNFTVVTNSVAENAGTVVLNVRRTGGLAGAAGVTYKSSTNGTATSGVDFTPATGTLSFAAGDTNKTITVKITDDSLIEGTETFSVALSAPSGNATLGTNGTAVVNILDDDLNSFAFSAATASVAENATNVVLTVNRTGSTNATSVKYAATAGTAKAGVDFTATTGTLSFANGDTSKTITVPILDNQKVDGDRLFTMVLSAPATNSVIGTNGIATVTITDNDTMVAFTAATATVRETDTNVVLTLVRTGLTNSTVSVNYATTNGTAVAGTNYTSTNGVVTFSPGVTNQTITVPVLYLHDVTGTQNFSVKLSSPTNTLLGTLTNATVSLLDTDFQFDFSANALSLLETDTKGKVTVRRTGGTWATNIVAITIAGAPGVNPYNTNSSLTALPGTNLVTTNYNLTFLPGVTNQTVPLSVLHDSAVTGDRTGVVSLSIPSQPGTYNWIGYTGTNSAVVLTIQDVDSTFNFATVTNNVAENAGTVVLNVRRTGGLAAAATVTYKSSTNGTATSGVDFTPATGSLSFAAGDTNKTITVKITNDSLLESDETFTVALSAPTGNATLGTNSTAVVNILEDDLNSFAFSAATASVAENGTNVVLTVNRTGSTNATSVKYAATAGTAKAGVDFTATSGTLSFANGDTSKTITVPILDNQKVDGDRVFTVALNTPATNSVIGTTNTVTVTIADDDTSVAFNAATASVLESATNVVLTLVRTGVTNSVVSVDYATANGTALAGSDYTNKTGTVTFNAGETNKTISIPVVADSLIEGKETFSVQLTSPTNTYLGKFTNTVVTILDANVEFDFATTSVTNTVLETAGKATLTVWRLGGTTATNTVDFSVTTNGTAAAGVNFTSTNGTLTFLPGVTNLTVTLPVLHDGAVAGDLTAEVGLSNAGGTATIGTNDTALVTIRDVDSTFNFAVITNTVAKSGGSVTLNVQRTGGLAGASTVRYATANGTATSGVDYTAASGTLSFAAGVTTKTVVVKITAASPTTNNTSFTVALTTPVVNGLIGTNSTAVVNITQPGGALGDVVPLTHLGIRYDTNGQPTLTIVGPANSTASIESTADLETWSSQTQMNLGEGTAEWTDEVTAEDTAKFYRVLLNLAR